MQSEWKEKNVGFIGGGNMAKAIGCGLIEKGCLTPSKIWVSARTLDTLSSWKSLGVHTTLNNHDILLNTDIIFLAVKPHMLDQVLDDLKVKMKSKDCSNNHLYISVLAGVSLEVLNKKISAFVPNPRIIRCMPNTPVLVGAGITAYCMMNTTSDDEALVEALLSCLGVSQIVPESLMNAIGGIAGSGPAYAYIIIEALADGAVRMGVPRASAIKFAAQVLIGAGKMVLETGKHPGQLKDEVCSPGGTTITAVHELERGQVRGSMMNAIEAAVNKCNQMSRQVESNK